MVDVSKLSDETLQSFNTEGDFGIQWKDECPFTAVSDDHAMKWVNGLSKSATGLTSITQIDTATLK